MHCKIVIPFFGLILYLDLFLRVFFLEYMILVFFFDKFWEMFDGHCEMETGDWLYEIGIWIYSKSFLNFSCNHFPILNNCFSFSNNCFLISNNQSQILKIRSPVKWLFDCCYPPIIWKVIFVNFAHFGHIFARPRPCLCSGANCHKWLNLSHFLPYFVQFVCLIACWMNLLFGFAAVTIFINV